MSWGRTAGRGRTAGSPSSGSASCNSPPDVAVPGVGGVEALFEHDAEARVQRVEHRDGRGVVIAAGGADVVGEQREVEVPRLRGLRRGRGPRSTARGEKLTGDSPGGTPRHFCVPE